LIGILKHKLGDFFRKSSREVPAADLEPEALDREIDYYDEKGMWRTPPRDWETTPASLLQKKEFWEIFTKCLDGLPASQRAAFSLKEIDGMKSEEICKVLEITPTNLWVLLHRSRSGLRECLESTWFTEEEEDTEVSL
jgi:RNA polymerase sigma-70 factor (ECF subfamily)